MQQNEIAQMHWDITKLPSLGVSEEFLEETTPLRARELLKGLLYLRERYGSKQHYHFRGSLTFGLKNRGYTCTNAQWYLC